MTRLLLAFALLCAAPARAAEVRVLTAGAFRPVVAALAPAFEQQTGNTLVVENDTAGGLVRRIGAGQAFDLVVMPPAAIGQVADRVAAGAPVPVARVGIGVAVRQGAAVPDVGSAAAFRTALLRARHVAVIDPASGGSSGVFLAGLFERMGIADALRPGLVLVPGGLVAERLLDGSADLAVHQNSELLAVPGVVLAGPIPAEYQSYTVYAGAVGAAAQAPDAARALLGMLAGPAGAVVLRDKGMEAP